MTLDYFYGQSGELFSYFRIPKALFQDSRFRQLSTDARTLYGILLDRMSLSVKNGWLDEQGRVYIIYTVREVQESLCCAEHKAVKLFRELEQIDLIERKRRGLGRPSLIYVKDFSSGLPKAQVQNCPNSNSGAAESAILEQPKPQANKTDKNKTEWNDPDPIYSGGIREQLEDYFYQALEVELLLRLCPDDEDTIYQIVDLLVDTYSTKRKMLRIAGDDKPAEVVRSRLKKLNADHIRFVLDSLAENTAPVRNMKQYLLAMLYNAPTTMSLYSADEIHALTEVAEGTKLEIPVLLASFYGLRRSEVLGLKWDAIDFEANTLEIKHIVTQASIDGKKVLVQADRAKTKSSLRTLPLVPPIRDRLLMLKGQQNTYRRLCGKSYNRDYLGYLCVDEIGNIIRPNYVSEQFPKLLEKNGLRPIRFHDLRHSCASLLLANGVPMKQIQEWLGHSDFSTTANIYAHLDYASKLSSAQAMLEGLGYGNASAWCHTPQRQGGRAMFRQKKNGQTNKIHLSIRFGGASGSRTLAPVSRPIAFRVFEIVG